MTSPRPRAMQRLIARAGGPGPTADPRILRARLVLAEILAPPASVRADPRDLRVVPSVPWRRSGP